MPLIGVRPGAWIRRKVQLKDEHGRELRTVQAQVLGSVAVHPSTRTNDPTWAVTAIPSSKLLCRNLASEVEALRLGQVLHDKFREQLREVDIEKLRESLPEWVRPWLMECYEKQAYVPLPNPSKV